MQVSENLEELINKCLKELETAYKGECTPEHAERNAALFLIAQIRLASYISNIELVAKTAKSEVERASSEKYFEYKKESANTSPKLTEAALEHAILKDKSILDLKKDLYQSESDMKKWNYIFSTLSNGHIFYRNLGKRES